MLNGGHRTLGGERQFQCRIRVHRHQRARKLFGGGNQDQISNTFKEAITLLRAARWKMGLGQEIASLEKHGVYELAPITSVPNGRKVVGTRWVYKIKADGVYKG